MSIFKRKNVPSKPAPRQAAKPEPTKEAPKMATHKDEDLKTEHRTASEELNRAAVHVADSIRNAIDRMKNAGDPAKADVSAMEKITKSLRDSLDDINDLAAKEPKKKKGDEE